MMEADSELQLRRTREELLAVQASNAETYDRSILQLSTAFLAFSVTFISDVVSVADARWKWWLFASWIAFAAAIITTIVSFMYAQPAIQELVRGAYAFYIHGDTDALKRSEVLSRRMALANVPSGVLFMAGIICTVVFAVANVGDPMPPGERDTKHAQPITPYERPVTSPQPQAPPPPTEPAPPAPAPSSPPPSERK